MENTIKLSPEKLQAYNRINELKLKLRKSDYKAIKYAEGAIGEGEYSITKEQRQAWRDEINALEEIVK